jgi:hypothetical protein
LVVAVTMVAMEIVVATTASGGNGSVLSSCNVIQGADPSSVMRMVGLDCNHGLKYCNHGKKHIVIMDKYIVIAD